jgi:SAM-dependent methyltransferase
VLDVGCGTGIAARQFQASGCRVLGVDVDARMAAFARRRGVDVEVARFERWEPAGRSFDAVIAGQTWHWIDPVAGAAKAAAVLRPRGRLALFRNDPRLPPELGRAFGGVYARVLSQLPINPHRQPDPGSSGADRLSDAAIHDLRRAGGFGAVQSWSFAWQRPYTRTQWLDELPTSGLLTRLPPEPLAELLAQIGAAIDTTTADGAFTVDYTTTAIVAERTVT